MNDLLSKISSYHLFNYLLPGCLFAVLATRVTHREFIQPQVVLGLFLYYFYGLVISRLGSLVLEPFLRRINFLSATDYGQFVAACKKDPKIDVLSESNNMYRTLVSLLMALILAKGFTWVESRYPFLRQFDGGALIFVLLVIFLLSYRKQDSYITKRIKANQEAV